MPEIIPGHACYWVEPGRFLAGAYPIHRFNEVETRRRLRTLVELGMDQFLDLTQAHELPDYTDLLNEEAGWLDHAASHTRHPIQDFGVPSHAEMTVILDALDAALAQGRHIYLHCYGGIGRTGTVVCCYLVRHGMPPEQALVEVNRLRAAAGILFPPSPEADTQRELVLSWQAGE